MKATIETIRKMNNCPVCESDMKDIKGGFSICRKCGNVYVPINEIPSEYPPKISATLRDTHVVENKRLLAELIRNSCDVLFAPGSDVNPDSIAISLADEIQEKFEVKKKE